MIYASTIDANTAKIIRTNWDNDVIAVYVYVKRKGGARLFWATDDEWESKNVPTNYEIQLGESVYLVDEGRNNLIILNQQDIPQQVYIEVRVNPLPPCFRPISATSGFG